jgi:glutamate synthase domain-containing protein 3
MSGGFAYVLDEDGSFEKNCNTGMVELEALDTEDAVFVAALLEEHVEHTGSEKAKHLLANWEATLSRFVKVVPTEYRKVLEKMKSQNSTAVASRDSLRVLAPKDPLSGEAQG